ncbi:family 20 glycosylhydrolase [Thalassotalea fusca]
MNTKMLVSVIGTALLLGACDPVSKNVSTAQNQQVQSAESSMTQASIDNIASSLDIRYTLINNHQSEKCETALTDGLCFEAKFTLTANTDLPASGWEIYYSQIAPLHNYDSEHFQLVHINGDLHRLSPKAAFTGLKVGQSTDIIFRGSYWNLSEYDIMPNFIVTGDGLEARVIDSTRAVIDAETGLELLPHVTAFSDYHTQFKRTENDNTPWLTSSDYYQRNLALATANDNKSKWIIPTPKSIDVDKTGSVSLSSGFTLTSSSVEASVYRAAIERLATLGFSEKPDGVPLSLTIVENNTLAAGSYQLAIDESGIQVVGVDGAGVANGLQSIASLIQLDKPTIPFVKVQDEPLFEFRGVLVEVARNFRSKEFILNLLEQMAAYKLNKLHLHMGDDEGWRIEIPGLPELTDIGSKRCFDLNDETCLAPQLGAGVNPDASNNGYYSVADYSEILAAASARHIQVIPSLDMPGHSRAAIKAMAARYKKYAQMEDYEKAEQYLLHDPTDTTVYSSVQFYNDNTINVCRESSFAFVEKVMTEVQKLHADAGQPLTRYHIGADETAGAWLESDICKAFIANNEHGVTSLNELGAYFVERVANMISEMGIEPAAWSDGLEHTRKDKMPAVVQANGWDHLPWNAHVKVHELANRNWQMVISTPDVTYFDFPYEADPKEHGYYWASRKTNTEKVFQFMPENLPVHAEFWLDRQDNPYVADDRLQTNENGEVTHRPLSANRKFYGLQAQLWSENVRTDDFAEHKLFPRLIALAERAWYLPSWAVPYNYSGARYAQDTNTFTTEMREARDKEWRAFATAIGKKELPKLEKADIAYRLPLAGGEIIDGKLHANTTFPGLTIEYKAADSQWRTYQAPVEVTGKVYVRTATHTGKRKGRTLEVN